MFRWEYVLKPKTTSHKLTTLNYLCTNYKPGYRVPGNRKEESPDSIGQCTGEEPGLSKMGTDSATENNRHGWFTIRDKGENVR